MTEEDVLKKIILFLVGLLLSTTSWAQSASIAGNQAATKPPPRGKLVDLGGHRLHFDCRGRGLPTVIIENGSHDFSFDWIFVQSGIAKTNRVCTYDRSGYAWSDPRPTPHTLAQI